jgi:DNA-(apurinic or apyrimidinic site) lyase
MIDLYSKLNKYSLEDAIRFEKFDRQSLALQVLYKNKKFDNEVYLFLMIINALICYQLSGKGEDYWEEFSVALYNEDIKNFEDIRDFFEVFLPNSKNNKRFVSIKLKRIKKIEKFYDNVQYNNQFNIWEYYYKNMELLTQDLASTMNQKVIDKTIVFAVKIFGYASRNVFGYVQYYPKVIMLPIDSRLEKIYKKYTQNNVYSKKDIQEFYLKLSKKLEIPLLHLDTILWLNYDKLVEI